MRGIWAALFIVCIPSIAHAEESRPLEEPPPVVVIMPAPPEPAPPEKREEPEQQTHWLNGGFSVGIGTVVFQPNLSSTRFRGSGVPFDGAQRQQFSHVGREIGIQTPILWGGELRVSYARRYFEIGVHGFVAGHPGGADEATNHTAAELADSSSIFAYGGGLQLMAAFPAGPVSFMVGPDVGMRGYSIPLDGFLPTTCKTKHGGSVPCSEKATALQPYVQPRITIAWAPSEKAGGFIAAFVGSDLYPTPSMVGGITFGVGMPHEALAP